MSHVKQNIIYSIGLQHDWKNLLLTYLPVLAFFVLSLQVKFKSQQLNLKIKPVFIILNNQKLSSNKKSSNPLLLKWGSATPLRGSATPFRGSAKAFEIKKKYI